EARRVRRRSAAARALDHLAVALFRRRRRSAVVHGNLRIARVLRWRAGGGERHSHAPRRDAGDCRARDRARRILGRGRRSRLRCSTRAGRRSVYPLASAPSRAERGANGGGGVCPFPDADGHRRSGARVPRGANRSDGRAATAVTSLISRRCFVRSRRIASGMRYISSVRPRVPSFAGRLGLYCGLALSAWAYYAYEWGSFANFVRETDHCQLAFCDFVNHYYPQAQEIVDAVQPVDGFMYSATFAWVLAPIGRLPPVMALKVWAVLQAVLTALMVLPLSWLFLKGTDRFWWRLAYFALSLTSIPLLHNFKWGQVSVLLTLCVIAAAFLDGGGGVSVLAGFLMAFAAAIKFYPALFFLAFLFRKQWLAFASAVVLAVLMLALPMWPMGYDHSRSFYTGKVVPMMGKEIVEDPNAQYFIR